MAMKNITVNTPDKSYRYSVKEADELTLADWKVLTPIEADKDGDEFATTYRIVSAFTGIPIEELDKHPMQGVQTVVDAIEKELVTAYAGSAAFKEGLEKDGTYTPPKVIDIDGIPYRVPTDMELETTVGQWADWSAWKAPEHEADLVAETLAFMLTVDGKPYNGTPADKVEAMMQCPMAVGMDVCAFFFGRSERFRRAMSARSLKFRASLKALLLSKAVRISPSDTAALIFSLEQPS